MHEARYYTREGEAALCGLCPRKCRVAAGQSGHCGVRSFLPDASLFVTDNYGIISSQSLDPIEKKPLYHFHPGKPVFSIGTYGCNLNCQWCQNWQISQLKPPKIAEYSPQSVIQMCQNSGAAMIAYTYSEPIVWFEFVMDTAQKALESGIENVLVTNGNCEVAPWKELLRQVQACNIDLKGFSASTLAKYTGASLRSVCDSIEYAAETVHLEISTLIVPGVNDTLEELGQIASFIASLNRDIPWHIARYYPNYRYSQPPTEIEFIREVHAMAQGKLNHVYCGNFPLSSAESDTYCPDCGALLIQRRGYRTQSVGLKAGLCRNCGRRLYFVD